MDEPNALNRAGSICLNLRSHAHPRRIKENTNIFACCPPEGRLDICMSSVMTQFPQAGLLEYSQPNFPDDYILSANIRRFRELGDKQYTIIATGHSPNRSLFRRINREWNPNRRGRSQENLDGTCMASHFMAMTMEWEGRPNQSRIIVTMLDPYRGRDHRYGLFGHSVVDTMAYHPIIRRPH